jgi:hypothetical protein
MCIAAIIGESLHIPALPSIVVLAWFSFSNSLHRPAATSLTFSTGGSQIGASVEIGAMLIPEPAKPR